MFRCGPNAEGTRDDMLVNEAGQRVQSWPEPWWIECDRCHRLRLYHAGGWMQEKTGDRHICNACRGLKFPDEQPSLF